jgi:hypothetical protein
MVALIVFLRDDSGIRFKNSFVALVSLNFWCGQPLFPKGVWGWLARALRHFQNKEDIFDLAALMAS